MYLAVIVIGNISFSFMLVGVESVRHNSTLFYGQERADVAGTPGAGLRSTAPGAPGFPTRRAATRRGKDINEQGQVEAGPQRNDSGTRVLVPVGG